MIVFSEDWVSITEGTVTSTHADGKTVTLEFGKDLKYKRDFSGIVEKEKEEKDGDKPTDNDNKD